MLVAHLEHADDAESFRIQAVKSGAAVAHVEPGAVVGESPALGGITKDIDQLERFGVVDEAGAFAPGELDQAIPGNGQSFAEIARRQRPLRQHPPAFQIHLANRGLAVAAGALVEDAAVVDQTLGEGSAVVGILGDDPVAQARRRVVGGASRSVNERKKQEHARR